MVHAREVVVTLEGNSINPQNTGEHVQTIWSHQDNLASFLIELGEVVLPGDQVYADGKLVSEKPLSSTLLPGKVDIVRQKEVTIRDGDQETAMITTATTVGEALVEARIRLHVTDDVIPAAGSWLMPGSEIEIRRPITLAVHVDGQVVNTLSHHRDVMVNII